MKVIYLFPDSKRRIQYKPNPKVFDLLGHSGKLVHDPQFEVNRDYQKRDRLLHISVNWLKEEKDNGGIEEFEGLNVKTLEDLLLNGFVLPWHCQNASPTVAEIFWFMSKYPQVFVLFLPVCYNKDSHIRNFMISISR